MSPAIPPDRVVVPSRDDPIARAASEVAGGPLGRYAVPLVRGWRRLAVGLVAASAVPMALGVALRGHCIESGWSSPDQFFHMCYSDLPTAFEGQNLGAGISAFLAGGIEAPTPAQPPLTALLLALTGGWVSDGSAVTRARLFFGIWAILIALLLALTVWWTASSVRGKPLRSAHVALSPVVALTAVVSADIVAVALAAAALAAWGRARLLSAGVLLGLAISARSYPVLILVAIVLVAARAGRLRAAGVVVGAAVATAAAIFAVVLVGNPDGALRGYAEWAGADAGFGSPWVFGQLTPSTDGAIGLRLPDPISPPVLTLLTLTGWIVAVLVGAWLAGGGERRPGVAEVSLVMIAIVLVTGKSFPVQASLWLVPLVALVGLRWRDHLIWASAEALHFGGVWLYLAGTSTPDRGLPSGWYALTLVVRLAGVGWLVVQTWRMARDRLPQLASPAESDPLAGPLANAPDALIVRVG
ncbi:MAG: glycosyltransferase 87 family protein [Candidatus Phosphoribacter sp.]